MILIEGLYGLLIGGLHANAGFSILYASYNNLLGITLLERLCWLQMYDQAKQLVKSRKNLSSESALFRNLSFEMLQGDHYITNSTQYFAITEILFEFLRKERNKINYNMSYGQELLIYILFSGSSYNHIDRIQHVIKEISDANNEYRLVALDGGNNDPFLLTFLKKMHEISRYKFGTRHYDLIKNALFELIDSGKQGKQNIGGQDRFGKTALMYACEYRMMDIVDALLATGQSNPNAMDYATHTAGDYAKTPALKYVIQREQAYERRKYVL